MSANANSTVGLTSQSENLLIDKPVMFQKHRASHDDIAKNWLNEADAIYNGEYEVAAKTSATNLLLFAEMYSDNSVEYAYALNRHGVNLMRLKFYDQAITSFEKGLFLHGRILGVQHNRTLLSINNTVIALTAKNGLEQTKILTCESLQRKIARYGDQHRETAIQRALYDSIKITGKVKKCLD